MIIIDILVLSALLYCAVADYSKGIIPDKAHLILLVLGVFRCAFFNANFLFALIAALGFGTLFLIVGLATNSIGGGDIKLIYSLTFAQGIENTFAAILIALFTFALCAILKGKPRKCEMCFAPFILVGQVSVFALKNLL
ncbi:MAG: A24 family peptidase [Oscillospiraceae bacterium]